MHDCGGTSIVVIWSLNRIRTFVEKYDCHDIHFVLICTINVKTYVESICSNVVLLYASAVRTDQ